MRRLLGAALLLVCAWVSPAHAALKFFATNDACGVAASGAFPAVGQSVWDKISGAVAADRTVDTGPKNYCSLLATITTGSTSYVSKVTRWCNGGTRVGYTCLADTDCPSSTCSAALTEVYAGMAFDVPPVTFGLPSGKRRVVMRFTDGTNTGCMATLEATGLISATTGNSTSYVIKVFYGSPDVAPAGECGASFTMNGTACGGTCTSNADCVQAPSSLHPTTPTCVKNTDGTTCAGGACHCTHECDESFGGEATCAPGVYAATPALTKGTWYDMMLGQINGTGTVQCILWQGTAGATPLVYQRGAQSRNQGVCNGTDTNFTGHACAVNADCGTGGCTTTSIIPISRVDFGASDTGTGQVNLYMDSQVVYDTSPNVNWLTQALIPDGVTAGGLDGWSSTGCSSVKKDCVNDPLTILADGSTSYVDKSNQINLDQDFDLDAPATPTPIATPLAVNAEIYGRADSSVQLDVKLRLSSTSGTDYPTFNASVLPDQTNYYQFAPLFSTAKPGGGSYATSDLPGLGLRLSKVAANNSVRVSSLAVGVLYRMPDPVVTTFITDQPVICSGGTNTGAACTASSACPGGACVGDGHKRLAIIGDSTTTDEFFYNRLVAQTPELTDVCRCSRGGTTLGDVRANLTPILNTVTSSATSYMPCTAFKGTCDGPADIGVLWMLANSAAQQSTELAPTLGGITKCIGGANNGVACAAQTDCPSGSCTGQVGYCDDNGGANQGRPCTPKYDGEPGKPSYWRTDASAGYRGQFCRNKGSHFREQCVAQGLGATCLCATNADCKINTTDTLGVCQQSVSCTGGHCSGNAAAGLTCTTVADCKACTTNAFAGFRADQVAPPVGWCWSGDPAAADCPNGLCIAGVPAARNIVDTIAILDAAAAHAAHPVMILAAPPPGTLGAGISNFSLTRDSFGAFAAWARAYTTARGKNFLDAHWEFINKSPDQMMTPVNVATGVDSSMTFLRDEIHWTEELGSPAAAGLISECVNQTSGSADGVCTSATCSASVCATGQAKGQACSVDADCGYCSAGTLGRRCAANADCNRYRCVL